MTEDFQLEGGELHEEKEAQEVKRRAPSRKDHEAEPVHIISLGAGVQSSAMAIMATRGLIKPMPECAIFADTGDEPSEVYRWVKELARHLTFPIVHLKTPRLSDNIDNAWGFSQLPSWAMNNKGEPAPGKRQCTKYFKILPVRHEIRKRFPNRDCVLWIGISTDEATRAKDSGRKWIVHRWPLLDLRKSRGDCVEYLRTVTSWRVPKSACKQCPYRGPEAWRESLDKPDDMETIRRVESVLNPRGEFLTKHMKPIEHIDFSTEEDRGQVNLFENECEGMCGV